MLQNAPFAIFAIYFGAINVASAGLFWFDKFQAQNKGWRIPEKQLQLSALLGGWVGGMWAMQTFKHKTVKQEFKIPYYACVGANVAVLTGGFFVLSGNSRMQNQAKQFAQPLLKQLKIKI